MNAESPRRAAHGAAVEREGVSEHAQLLVVAAGASGNESPASGSGGDLLSPIVAIVELAHCAAHLSAAHAASFFRGSLLLHDVVASPCFKQT